MEKCDIERGAASRRRFLQSGSAALAGVWAGVQWSSVAAAAHHAERAATRGGPPPHLEFLSVPDAADVDAVCGQIVPSGITPGAREARAVYFIDRSLSTYLAAAAPEYRQGLAGFQGKFRTAQPALASFASADFATQLTFLRSVDEGSFFETTRTLTVLGMFSSPQYGGNYQGAGWKLLGFVDQHAFNPPFGYYDAEYSGFVPYPTDVTS